MVYQLFVIVNRVLTTVLFYLSCKTFLQVRTKPSSWSIGLNQCWPAIHIKGRNTFLFLLSLSDDGLTAFLGPFCVRMCYMLEWLVWGCLQLKGVECSSWWGARRIQWQNYRRHWQCFCIHLLLSNSNNQVFLALVVLRHWWYLDGPQNYQSGVRLMVIFSMIEVSSFDICTGTFDNPKEIIMLA